MKKVSLLVGLILLAALTSCGNQKKPDALEETTEESVLIINSEEQPENSRKQEQENTKMKIQIGDTVLTATLEDNETAEEFKELVKKGGFEQVGSIGTSLPRNDVQTTTKAGDIVLYAGNQLVMFYGSNSWSYTRIGKFDSTKDLNNMLDKENITADYVVSSRKSVKSRLCRHLRLKK